MAVIANLKVITVRDQWGNARHAMFTDDGMPIDLQAAYSTDAHLHKLKAEEAMDLAEGIWIAEDWQGNYYHWLIRHLPKLMLMERLGTTAPLILPKFCGMQSVIDESLDALGWGIERRVYVDADVIRLRRGFITQLASCDQELVPQLADRLRLVPELDGPGGVFVSRAGASKRRILEEDRLSRLLEACDVHTMRLEDLNFEQQRKLMSGANVLVGMHGAGLTNMLFMPPGGLVVEIHADNATGETLFGKLAKVLGHKYLHVPATRLTPALGLASDVRVDLDAMAEVTRLITAHRSITHH